MELLAIAVKEDRLSLKMSQRKAEELAQTRAKNHGISGLRTRFMSFVERGIAREVPLAERWLIADILQQPQNRYDNCETSPLRVISNLSEVQDQIQMHPTVERSIEFPPQFRQAAVGILSYFSEVLERKYPDQEARVNILQDGNTITLRVETDEGQVDEIERTLTEYGLVVTGQMPIDAFTKDRELIRDLKTRLELTSLELRLRQETYIEGKKHYEGRVLSLEEQVGNLYHLVSIGLTHSTSLADIIKSATASQEIEGRIAKSLEAIALLSKRESSPENVRKLNEAFGIVRKESPTLYGRLVHTLESIPASVMANLATPWVQVVINSLLK
ncbi:MAG: hypothetical protein KKA54_08100 [Proteobacteria bacterium]|nr:hypothetical protein [Pseudomonadota bacterium]